MSETPHDEKPQFDPSLTKAQEGLDWNKLADAFAARGNVGEAERFRNLARKQPEIEARAAAKRQAAEEQRKLELQDQERRIQEERAKPKPFHDPQFDVRSNKGLREQVEIMLQVKGK